MLLYLYEFSERGGTIMCDHKTIAETNNFIVLDKYTKIEQQSGGYQTEADLERELIQDLVNQGYEYLPNLTTPEKMLDNVRKQLQILNNMQFSDGEWKRFIEQFLDKPSDNVIDKTRKVHDNYRDWETDRKSTRLNSSHITRSRMPSSA